MSLLDNIKIPMPCPISWESMRVSSKTTRYCDHCKSNVYDIASMTAEQAEALIRLREPLCINIYKREDGKVKTRDCRDASVRDIYQMPEIRGRYEIQVTPKRKPMIEDEDE